MVVRDEADHPSSRVTRNGKGRAGSVSLPLVTLPPRVPRQPDRLTQPSIPNSRQTRDGLKTAAARHVEREALVPPLTIDELSEHASHVLSAAGLDTAYRDFATILVSNAAWRDMFARIPFQRRLLLLPKCLRNKDRCRAPVDEFGLLCLGCESCVIHDLTLEAEQLGYAVLVAEGSAVVLKMIEARRIEGILGVSCTNVLEQCFPHMEMRAIPGVAVPLLQDGCADTTVDLDWIRDALHLTSDDQTHRLDLDAVKREVRGWFTEPSLASVLGSPAGETDRIAHAWMARAGKRWRPYLTVCVYMALKCDRPGESAAIPHDLKRLAIAVECFHKASLAHDDIEDDDALRYGEKTLHVEHGVPIALNVGDYLLGQGYRLIGELDVEPQTRIGMLRTAADGHLTLSRGQGAELCWARWPGPLKSVEVLDVFRQKTAPAFEVALRLGAYYASAGGDVHDVLSRYSESLGIAYQIRDDLEDFSGKGDSNDLRDVRMSLILAIAYKRAADCREAELISALCNRTGTYDGAADEIRRIIISRGVIDTAQDLLEAYARQATRSLRSLTHPTLKGLLRRVIGKIFGERSLEGYCSEFEARTASGREARAEPIA